MSDSVPCPHCKQSNPSGASRCRHCGLRPGDSPQTCPDCAEGVGDDDAKCPHCGSALKGRFLVDTLPTPEGPAPTRAALALVFLGGTLGLPCVTSALTDVVYMGNEPGMWLLVGAPLLLLLGGLVALWWCLQRRAREGDPVVPTVIVALLLLGAGIGLSVRVVEEDRIYRTLRKESSAIGALKTIGVAQSLFREADKEADGNLDYGSLQELGAAGTAGLIDPILASGTKSRYTFEATYGATTSEFIWFAVASPIDRSAGARYFATNQEGVTYYRFDAPFKLNSTNCTIPAGPAIKIVGK